MSTENAQTVANLGETPSGCGVSSTSADSSQNLPVGFAVMDPKRQKEIAKKGGKESGRRRHEDAMRKHGGYDQ